MLRAGISPVQSPLAEGLQAARGGQGSCAAAGGARTGRWQGSQRCCGTSTAALTAVALQPLYLGLSLPWRKQRSRVWGHTVLWGSQKAPSEGWKEKVLHRRWDGRPRSPLAPLLLSRRSDAGAEQQQPHSHVAQWHWPSCLAGNSHTHREGHGRV